MPRFSKQDRQQAIEELRKLLPPGTTVYTVLRHVARSGMSRDIDVYVFPSDGGETSPRWLSHLVAKATGFTFTDRRDALRVGGCGMDMGFHVVSTLSRVLYPDGFGCLGDGGENRSARCPSNDHSNGDRDYTPHDCNADRPESGNVYASHHTHQGPARGKYGTCHWHTAGDYALRHRWL